MIDRVKTGVVRIETSRSISPSKISKGTGSGVIFEKEPNWGAAWVLTNYHVIEEVIADFEPNISVTVNDSEVYGATVVGVDINRDLAVLKICCQRFTALSFGNASDVEIGEPVVNLGYALGLRGAATATRGIVSGLRFETDDDRWVVQTDAPINPGNSGGPLLSLGGKVLGINTYKFGGFLVEGVGFAIAENTVQEQLPRLKNGGDATDAVNVLAQWAYGPGASSERVDIRVNTFPWVLEWNLEEGGTLLQVSARNVYSSTSLALVNTTVPGTGRVVVYEAARFLMRFKGEGRYTVTIKTATPAPKFIPTPSPIPTATPKPTPEGGQQNYFHIAVSGRGVFVADTLSRKVRVYSLGGALLQEWSAERLGTEDISGIAVSESIVLDVGRGFLSPSRIYLTDRFNHRVTQFTTNGTFVDQWGAEGTAEGQLKEPGDIAIDGSNVFVVDTGNNRVQRFSSGGAFISGWGSVGNGGTQFRRPTGTRVHEDSVYVVDADNHRVQVFTRNGAFLREWGTKGIGSGEFIEPRAVAAANRRVYVVDTGNNRVQVFSLGGTFLGKWGIEGSGEGQFRTPIDIGVQGSTVYVVDEGNSRMQLFSIGGDFLSSWSITR